MINRKSFETENHYLLDEIYQALIEHGREIERSGVDDSSSISLCEYFGKRETILRAQFYDKIHEITNKYVEEKLQEKVEELEKIQKEAVAILSNNAKSF